MSGEDETEKTFEATQQKLDEARKKGEIAKSNDLITAAGYVGFVVAAVAFGADSMIALGDALAGIFIHADSLSASLLSGAPMPVMGGVLFAVFIAILPWFVLPAATAILAIAAQQAFVVAPTKLAPKLNRISIISGAKNKFGRQGLFEFAKSAVKLMIYCIILGLFLTSEIDRIIASLTLSPAAITVELGRLTVQLCLIVLVVAGTIGGIDFIFQRAEHLRKNRMSRKDVMDEMKSSEGDPMMKQQRRQRGRTLAMNAMLADVPTADVVIVNPTHYAVALKWDRMGGAAPICVAKGVDEIAARIREIAVENAVPLHSDPPSARSLHATVEVGEEIHPDHYRAVAAAIRFAESLRKKVVRE